MKWGEPMKGRELEILKNTSRRLISKTPTNLNKKEENKMKVEAEVKEMYKVTLGDDGMCMGQYYGEDDWKKSYYGETIEQILDTVNVRYYNGLPKTFNMEKWHVLIFDGRKYDYKRISSYNRYNKDSEELKEEVNQFYFMLNNMDKYKNERQALKEADKVREEKAKMAQKIKDKEEKEAKELAEYEYLKNKYDK